MDLLSQIKNEIDSHQIISFDIFDTLLLRPYVKPTDLFVHIEEIFGAKGFAKARVEAEKKARRVHKDYEDINLDEIYDEIGNAYKFLKSKELAFEAQVLQANPEMQAVFEYAKTQKKTIIIVSDMYLSGEFLKEVLSSKGYDGYRKLLVSSDYRKTKCNGTIYSQLIKELNIKADDVFHIGDNRHSDFKMATKAGFDAYCYTKPIDTLFKISERAKRFYEKNKVNIGASILVGLLSLNLKEVDYTEDSYWKTIGYCYAGPVMYGYMQWFIERVKVDGIEEVMFLGRDGYTLQKVFDLLTNQAVPSHYFYAPRYLNLVCNLDFNSYYVNGEESAKRALKIIFDYFKDKDDYLRENTPQITTLEQCEKFFQENISLYERLSKDVADDYKSYLEKFKVQGFKIALVDSCSQLLSAQKTLVSSFEGKDVIGYYWFVWPSNQLKNYKTVSYQKTRKNEFLDWNIMELFMTAPNPSVERIDKCEVFFKPANEHEIERIRVYPLISSGSVEFAATASRVFGHFSPLITAGLLVDWVNIFCTVYTEQDKTNFQYIQHAGDPEHMEWVPMPRPWFEVELKKTYRILVDIKLLGIPFIRLSKSHNEWRFYLFYKIPFLRVKSRPNKINFYFCGLPLIQKKILGTREIYKLFNIIPFLMVKRG